jgi:hypothetical protein
VKIQDVAVSRQGSSDRWTVTATVANEGYLDTSMEQARRTGVARADEVTIELPDGVVTDDPLTVEFPFLRGTRESSYVSLYRASWTVEAREGTEIGILLSSEKGGTDRRSVALGGPPAT